MKNAEITGQFHIVEGKSAKKTCTDYAGSTRYLGETWQTMNGYECTCNIADSRMGFSRYLNIIYLHFTLFSACRECHS